VAQLEDPSGASKTQISSLSREQKTSSRTSSEEEIPSKVSLMMKRKCLALAHSTRAPRAKRNHLTDTTSSNNSSLMIPSVVSEALAVVLAALEASVASAQEWAASEVLGALVMMIADSERASAPSNLAFPQEEAPDQPQSRLRHSLKMEKGSLAQRRLLWGLMATVGLKSLKKLTRETVEKKRRPIKLQTEAAAEARNPPRPRANSSTEEIDKTRYRIIY
jgi:hypothetical protein